MAKAELPSFASEHKWQEPFELIDDTIESSNGVEFQLDIVGTYGAGITDSEVLKIRRALRIMHQAWTCPDDTINDIEVENGRFLFGEPDEVRTILSGLEQAGLIRPGQWR